MARPAARDFRVLTGAPSPERHRPFRRRPRGGAGACGCSGPPCGGRVARGLRWPAGPAASGPGADGRDPGIEYRSGGQRQYCVRGPLDRERVAGSTGVLYGRQRVWVHAVFGGSPSRQRRHGRCSDGKHLRCECIRPSERQPVCPDQSGFDCERRSQYVHRASERDPRHGDRILSHGGGFGRKPLCCHGRHKRS